MKNLGKVVTALVAGVAIGTLLGVLFAPDKGSETRDKLDKKRKKMADDAKNVFQQAKEKLNELKHEAQEEGKGSPNEFI